MSLGYNHLARPRSYFFRN